MDLQEIAVLHESARLVAVGAEGGHEGGQHDHAGVEEQLGHLADAADVLLPVGIGEAEVLAEAVAHVVAIQHVGRQAALKQGGVDGVGQGALAGSGQAGEPEDGAAVATLFSPCRAVHGRLVPGDVGGCPLVGELSVGGAGGHDHEANRAAFSLSPQRVSVGTPPWSAVPGPAPPGPPAAQSRRPWRCHRCRSGS